MPHENMTIIATIIQMITDFKKKFGITGVSIYTQLFKRKINKPL